MPARSVDERTNHTRPPLSPGLAYEAASASDTPPTISAFVAEAVVYLSSAAAADTTTATTSTGNGAGAGGAETEQRDTTPVINAVVRLLDTMTATRYSRIQTLIANQEIPATSSAGSEDLGNSLLNDFDLAFQMPDYESEQPETHGILSDGSVVHLREREGDGMSPPAPPKTGEGFWRRMFSLSESTATPSTVSGSGGSSFFATAKKHLECEDVELVEVDEESGPLMRISSNSSIRSVQGYTWTSLADYQHDKWQRMRHFRQQLTGTRQFLERKTLPLLRQTSGAESSVDLRREKRRIWFRLYGRSPAPRLIAKLKQFHKKPIPIYDHFQLKNLLAMRNDKEIFYLGHLDHGDRKYTCVMSYNLQTQQIDRVLGPWSFNCARGLSHNSRPIYHSLSSISFESKYLFSVAVSENYVATSDTSSSILLSKRRRAPTPSGGSGGGGSAAGGGSNVAVAGHMILCQRVSSQPLQIINSIQLIELPQGCSRPIVDSMDDQDCDEVYCYSNELLDIIHKQAVRKSARVLTVSCQLLNQLFEQVKIRVALGQAWQKLKRDAEATELRSLRRLRTFFTPSAAAFMRNTVSIFHQDDSHDSSPENTDHQPIPHPSNLVVLTAGNDKTLCEYSLIFEMCRESTHIQLDNGDLICKLKPNGVSGFSACTGKPNARSKSFLSLTRSWQYPFCINRIAVHPDQNLLLLVGDNPAIIITSRIAATRAYYPKLYGTLKNSLFTIDFHQDASFAAAWHPDGIMFATGSDDRTIAIWDLRRLMAPLHVLTTEVTACRNLQFSPDGKFLLSCESEDAAVIYSVCDNFKFAQKIPFFGACTGATFSSDSKRIIIGVGPPGGLMELVISRQPAAFVKKNDEYMS